MLKKSPVYDNSTKVPCFGVEGLQLEAETEIKVSLRCALEEDLIELQGKVVT